MAKISTPLMSLQASGKIGERLTFSERKSGSQARFQKAQKIITPSWSQTDEQSLYRVIYARWLSFSVAEKKVYDDEVKSKKLQMSGWNLFLRYAIADPLIYLGLCGYWSFNRTNLGTILDLSKNGNTGTLKPLFPSDCPVSASSKNKKMLNAFSFDGFNDYIDCGDDASLNLLTALTIELWAKPAAIQEICYPGGGNNGNVGIASRTENNYMSTTWCWQLRYGSPDSCRLGFQFNTVYYGAQWATAKQDLIINKWNHIVGTFDGLSIKFYLNGELKDTNNLAGPTTIASYLNKFFICSDGWSDFTGYFNGLVDEVRVYNRALSFEEILNLYNIFN